MQMTARAFCKMRDLAAGLGVMLVGKDELRGSKWGKQGCITQRTRTGHRRRVRVAGCVRSHREHFRVCGRGSRARRTGGLRTY